MVLRVGHRRRNLDSPLWFQVFVAAAAISSFAIAALAGPCAWLQAPGVGSARTQANFQRRPTGLRATASTASGDVLAKLLELASAEGGDGEAKLAEEVDANFGSLTPQDLTGLQAKLAGADDAERPPLSRLTACIQKSMESRMEGATKEIQALMVSSGNIDDNIRECLLRQDSVLPIIAVLQMNIGRAQQSGAQQQEKALTYLLTAMNKELESKVPLANRILSRCLSTEDSGARRDLLKAFLSEGDAAAERPSELSQAIVGLVGEAEAKLAANVAQLQSTLELIRGVAVDAGVVVGEVCGEEAQSSYTEDLQPLFEALSRA